MQAVFFSKILKASKNMH